MPAAEMPIPCWPRDWRKRWNFDPYRSLPKILGICWRTIPGPLSDHADAVAILGELGDGDLERGEDPRLLAGVEGVVHRLLDRREKGLLRVVEAEQVPVLGEELGDGDLPLLRGERVRGLAGGGAASPAGRRGLSGGLRGGELERPGRPVLLLVRRVRFRRGPGGGQQLLDRLLALGQLQDRLPRPGLAAGAAADPRGFPARPVVPPVFPASRVVAAAFFFSAPGALPGAPFGEAAASLRRRGAFPGGARPSSDRPRPSPGPPGRRGRSRPPGPSKRGRDSSSPAAGMIGRAFTWAVFLMRGRAGPAPSGAPNRPGSSSAGRDFARGVSSVATCLRSPRSAVGEFYRTVTEPPAVRLRITG